MDILNTNDIKPLNTENINNFNLSELPRKISEQYENIKHLEEKVQDAMERAQDARDKASNANVEIGIFKHSKKKAIQLLQKAADGNAEALLSSVEAQQLLFEYQKKLTVITEELFGFCTFNIALTNASIDAITNLLKGAAEDDLSDLAQDELKKLLLRLKNQKSMFHEREKDRQELENHSHRLAQIEKYFEESKKEGNDTDIAQQDNSKKNCVVSKVKPLKNKNKFVAGLLAIFLGFFGIHWFYLGKPIRAIIYMAVYFAFPFIWLLYIMEGFFFFFCKKETFDSYRNKW